jgi:NAD(P)-dependent dehydrogenase (short-subunit alcohol dehydrogenase family)
MTENEPYSPGIGATVAAALVTGAAKRIGRAIALDLAAEGWAVAVHHRSSSSSEALEVVREIEAAGGRAVALEADLAREEEVARLLPAAAEALGPVTVLVNNAAPFEMDRIDTVTRASWDRHMEAGLRAPVVLIQALARQLPQGAHGNVINMLDQRVWNLTPYFLSYTVAKAGLWTLTRTLALALAPRIRVNGIGPGPTLPSPRQSDAQFRAQWAKMPLGRGTTPAELCRAVRFILASPSLTGQMIALDGGQHLGWAVPPRNLPPDD